MAIIFFRTLVIFLSLLIAMRLMGKRQLGELELSELVVAVLVSNIAAHPLQDIGTPLMNGLLPVIILLCCELLMSGLLIKSTRARAIICGKPSILIANGIVNQHEMKNNRFTPDELAVELRNQSLLDISKVKYAILETDGRLNIIPYPAEKPVTAGQLSLETEDCGYPMILINNGKVMSENLELSGKNVNWLQQEIQHRGAKRVEDVYLFTLNQGGQIYFALMEVV